MKGKLFVITTVFFLASCQQFNESLKSVNSGLAEFNSTLSGKSSLVIDQATQNATTMAIKNASPPTNASNLFNESSPYLSKFLNALSCNKDMKIYSDAKRGINASPTWHMKEHNSSRGCLQVSRVDDVKLQTAITYKFRVIFISPQSEETSKRYYEAVKQPSGDFLFRDSFG